MADLNSFRPQTRDKQLFIIFFLASALLFFNFFHSSGYLLSSSYDKGAEKKKISSQVLFLSPDGLIKQGRGDELQNPRLSFFLNQPMNINRATIAELELINGIGPRTAERIIIYRNEYGGFNNIHELENIHGIGPGTIRKMSGYVSFYQ